MRQDKTFARILLIFFVANVALAAPAVVRQRQPNEAGGVTATSRGWEDSDDEALDDWPPVSPAASFHDGPPPQQFPWWHWGAQFPHMWWLDGQDSELNHDSAPPSTAGSLSHSGSVGSMPELVSDSEESVNLPEPAPNSSPYLEEPTDFGPDRSRLASSDSDDSSHYLTPPSSPSGWNHHLTIPASLASSSRHHSVPEPANPPTLDDSVPESAVPYDSALESGAPPLHNNPASEVANPLTHDDDSAPSAHSDLAPEAAPSTHDDPVPVVATPSAHGDPAPDSGDPASHLDPVSESSATAPTAYKFFNDELKRKIKRISVLGSISAGVIYGLKKLKDKVSSGTYVSPLFASSPVDIKQVTNTQTYDLLQ